MAAKDVKFLANLGLHGSLRFLETNASFPENPSIGDVILKGFELFAYVKIGDFETWYPFANKTNAYIHTQGVAQLDWTVTHNLGTTDIWTQIRDSNNNIVYASMDNITANSFQLHFTEAITGTVVVVAPDSIDVPAVTTSIIQVGNVEITGSNITINGQSVLTGGDFATVATSGLFADLLSKPTTLAGYNISDAQPLDADLSAIAALNTTGFLKRTGADTWALDNSTYITGNQSITISGDASGSGTTSIALTLANSGVTAGDYTKVTVNGKGIVTSGSNPTTLAGYNISDAAPLSHVGSGGSAHAAATTSTSGFMSATDKTKLDGIGAGANVTSVAGKTGVVTLDNSDVGLGNVENKSSATIRSELTSGNVTTALGFTPENAANKNAANGYAGLDANSKISAAQLPAIAITNTFVVASQVAQLALTAETGDVAVRSDLNKSFILQGADPATLGHWQELLTPTDLVQSVNGMTGTVTISTISGNAGTATALQTARNITLDGDVSGSASFDGTSNITITTTVSNNSHDHSSIISGSNSASIDSDSFDVVVNGSNRLTVDSSGNAGLGVTPSYQLDLGGGTTVDTRIQARRGSDDANQNLRLGWNSIVSTRSNVPLASNQTDLSFIQTGSDGSRTNLYISGAGRVLIGSTTDDGVNKLQVNGSARISASSGSVSTFISSVAGTFRDLDFQTGTISRWRLRVDSDTESGSNVGSNFRIVSRDDSGLALNTPLMIYRSTSNVLINTTTDDGVNKLQVDGSILATKLNISGNVQALAYLLTTSTASYIRFGNSVSTAGYVGYTSAGNLDFQTASVSRVHISSAGALLVNTTSDVGSYKLVVNGTSLLGGTTKVYNETDAVFRIDSVNARAFTEYQLNSTAAAFVGVGSTANDLITGTAIGSLAIRTQGTSILFSTDSGVTANAVLASNGNFGVGVTPSARCHVYDSTDTPLYVQSTGIYSQIRFINASDNQVFIGSSGANLDLYTGGVARLSVLNSGNVGIGTSIEYGGKLNAKTNTDSIFRIAASTNVGSTGEGTALDVVNAAGTDVQPLLLRASLITFRNIGGEVARFAPTSGNLLLGTTTDGAKLRVVSANSGEYATEIINNGSTGANGLYVNIGASATGNVVRFDKNSSAALIVNNSGNTLVGTTVDASTRLYVRGVDQTSSNYAFVAADSNGNAGLAVRNDRHVLVHELLLVGGVSNDATHTLQVAGPLSVSNAGVDASLATAYTAYYNSNYTEKNVIQTSVSSTASSSGWYFRVSDGGGSGATTGIMSINRDAVRPMTDNVYNLGSGSNRWATIYAGTGTINTSDAREKTTVSSMTSDELNAAKQLAKEIGSFKFLSAIAAKGDDARKHIGMTVQRAIEIMELNNLNPFAYGFICYDQWNEKIEDGEVVLAAGDRYSFRTDELALFIARGQEERLSILEALAAQHLV